MVNTHDEMDVFTANAIEQDAGTHTREQAKSVLLLKGDQTELDREPPRHLVDSSG